MHCVNCGKSLRPEAVFCPQCGTKQPGDESAPPATGEHAPTAVVHPSEPAPSAPSQPSQASPDREPTYPAYSPAEPDPVAPPYDAPPPQKRRWPLILIIVLAILCLLCLCLAVIGFVLSDGALDFPTLLSLPLPLT